MRWTYITSESTLLVWAVTWAVATLGLLWVGGLSRSVRRPGATLLAACGLGFVLLVVAVVISACVEAFVLIGIRDTDPFAALYWISIRYTLVYGLLAGAVLCLWLVRPICRARREKRRVWRRVAVALAGVGVSTMVAWAWARARPGSELIRWVEQPVYASDESRFAILSLGLEGGDARLLPGSERVIYDDSIDGDGVAQIMAVLDAEDVTRDFGSAYLPICPACVAQGGEPLEWVHPRLRTGNVQNVIRAEGSPPRNGADLPFVGGWSKRPPPLGFRVFWSLGDGRYIGQVWVGPMFEKVPLPPVLVIGPDGQLLYIDDAELAVVLGWCEVHRESVATQ